ALKNADIEARGQGKPALSDDDVLGVLQKMIKQRHEPHKRYDKGGRTELAAQEREEITILSHYLPRQMTDQEIHDTIGALLKETGASAMKDMGRVMAALKERYAGKLDFGKASAAVKKLLSGGECPRGGRRYCALSPPGRAAGAARPVAGSCGRGQLRTIKKDSDG